MQANELIRRKVGETKFDSVEDVAGAMYLKFCQVFNGPLPYHQFLTLPISEVFSGISTYDREMKKTKSGVNK